MKAAAKSRNVLVRFSPDEFEAVTKAAGGNKQRFCRVAVLTAAGVPPSPELSPRKANGVVAHLPRCTCAVCKPKAATK